MAIDTRNAHMPERKKEKKTRTRKKGTETKQSSGKGAKEAVSLLKSEYDTLIQEKKEFEDKFLRTAAAYDNYRKRIQKEKDLWERGVYKEMLRDILSIYNSVNRGLEADDTSVSGFSVLKDQILAILEHHRVSPIEAKGKKFDPDYHEAVFTEETEEVPDKTVLEELEPGYMFDTTVLVPAKVKVSRNPGTGKPEFEREPAAEEEPSVPEKQTETEENPEKGKFK